MRFLSVCSGIEAASIAWNPLGWKAVGFSEIERFPCAVLKHHYPDVPNFGDMTKFQTWPDANSLRPDLICGGTPCQSFSVAGLRKGLADPRGNLALTFLALVERYRPRWVVWENVPGVLSSTSHDSPDPDYPPDDLDEGFGFLEVDTEDEFTAEQSHAFGCFLSGLSELGYGWAYRILDAQYFGVPQRRRRPFVVGYLGDWRRAAAVLFEPDCMRGNPPPRREARQRVAGTLTRSTLDGGSPCRGDGRDGLLVSEVGPTLSARTQGGGGLGTDFDLDGGLVAATVSAKGSGGPSGDECQNLVAHALTGEGFDASEDRTGRGTPLVSVMAPALTSNPYGENESREGLLVSFNPQAGGKQTSLGFDPSSSTTGTLAAHQVPAIAYNIHSANSCAMKGSGESAAAVATNVSRCLDSAGFTPQQGGTVAVAGMAVRRLTPRECERLQGFEDDYTLIPWRKKPADQCPDGPRYKALGNSWAIPPVRWIGRRIDILEREALE